MENDIKNLKPLPKYQKLTLMIIIIFLALLTLIIGIIIYPQKCISNINNYYDSQKYEKVSNYNSKLNILKYYLKNDDKQYKNIQYKVKLSRAFIFIKNDDYQNALTQLLEIKNIDTIVNDNINNCKYELGKNFLKSKQYKEALEFLQEVTNKEDINDLLDETYINIALQKLAELKYSEAISEINKVKNIKNESYITTKKQIHYEYGKYSLSRNDYNGGIVNLEKAKDYEDANTLLNNAYIEQAEKYIKAGNLKEAKNIYEYLPSELEHNGIKVSVRKNQLNKYASLIDSTGKKTATKSHCESRNVWKYDGRWENWYLDTVDSSEYIDTYLILNNDGTITLKGTVKFLAFNNFSSLAEYCKAGIFSRTIEIKNVHSIPSSYDIDENTKLLYSNGKFTLKYSKKDNYSTNFYNMYLSTVTY